MEPMTVTATAKAIIEEIAARSAEAAEATRGTLETSALNGPETTAEAREAIIGENGLTQQIDSTKFESIEAVDARNEAILEAPPSEPSQIEMNGINGVIREIVAFEELERECPPEDGFHIESECCLRDEDGNIARDPETGESRRVDFVAIKDGEVKRSIEVTSETADKTKQLEKEERIRDAGGNYVTDRKTGELAPYAPGVKTEIWRRA